MSGLFEDLERGMTSPLFLAGANLAFGNGMGGAMQGLQQGYGISKMRKDEAEKARRQAEFQGLFDNPETVKQFGPMAPIMRAAGPDQGLQMGGQFLMQQPGLEMQRQRFAHEQTMDRARLGETQRMNALQANQMKFQTPEGRAEIARQFNLQPGTPEYNHFSLTGQLPKPAGFMERLLAGEGQQQPPPPQPAAPSPVRPMSAPVEAGDPNLIRAQTAAPQSQPQQQEQMVDIPGFGPRPLSFANKLMAAAAAEKNQPLYDMVRDAVGKVPKALQDDVAKKMMESIDQVERLKGIRSAFRPEWQTYETTLKQRGLNIMDSFETLRDKIPEGDRKMMADYAAYRMEAIDNLNRYIKEMTGAAMSEQEAVRLRQAMPDPEKDSPTQFKAKLDNAIRLSELTHMRYAAIGKFGVTRYTPLSALPDIIQQRTNALQRSAIERGIPEDQVAPFVQQQLRKDFGGQRT